MNTFFENKDLPKLSLSKDIPRPESFEPIIVTQIGVRVDGSMQMSLTCSIGSKDNERDFLHDHSDSKRKILPAFVVEEFNRNPLKMNTQFTKDTIMLAMADSIVRMIGEDAELSYGAVVPSFAEAVRDGLYERILRRHRFVSGMDSKTQADKLAEHEKCEFEKSLLQTGGSSNGELTEC